MKVLYHKHFTKQYKKLSALQTKIDERIILFMNNPLDPVLNNHALAGKYKGRRSINITGDHRAVYELVKEDIAHFLMIDTHSNLYK